MCDDRQFYRCLNAAFGICTAIAAVAIVYLFATAIFAGKMFLLLSIATCGIICLWLKWGDKLSAKIGLKLAEK